MIVLDATVLVFQFVPVHDNASQKVLESMRGVIVMRYSTMLQAMEIPSYVLVPRPISSSITRLRGVILLIMLAVSFISTMKVDSPPLRLSEAPTRVNIWSVRPISAAAISKTTHVRHQCNEGCLGQER